MSVYVLPESDRPVLCIAIGDEDDDYYPIISIPPITDYCRTVGLWNLLVLLPSWTLNCV